MKNISILMVALGGVLILLDMPETATAFFTFAIWVVVFDKAG